MPRSALTSPCSNKFFYYILEAVILITPAIPASKMALLQRTWHAGLQSCSSSSPHRDILTLKMSVSSMSEFSLWSDDFSTLVSHCSPPCSLHSGIMATDGLSNPWNMFPHQGLRAFVLTVPTIRNALHLAHSLPLFMTASENTSCHSLS